MAKSKKLKAKRNVKADQAMGETLAVEEPSTGEIAVAETGPSKQMVYRHCSSIFTGPEVKVRQPKVVRRLLEENKGAIKSLTSKFSLHTISAVAKRLLDDGTFESEHRARDLFPDLFKTSKELATEVKIMEAQPRTLQLGAIEHMIMLPKDSGVATGASPKSASRVGKNNRKRSSCASESEIEPNITRAK